MTFFLLSFAGIPLTAGFIGKLTVFSAAMDAGLGALVVIAMIATAITAFFYLRVVVLMYFADGPAGRTERDGSDGSTYIVVPGILTTLVIAVCAALTLLLGILPSPALDLLTINLPLLS